MKTKEEIEQIGSEYYNSCSYIHLGFIHGYTQCQEALTTRILELEAQIESLTNVVVSEISCEEDYNYDINDNGLKWLIYYGKTKNNKYSIDDLGSIDWALIEGFRMLKTQTYYDAEKVESILWKRIRSILNLNPHDLKIVYKNIQISS